MTAGTETLLNWIENLRIARTSSEMSCSGCKVHKGFLDSWKPVQAPVVAEIKRLNAIYPRAKLYTTGHSLGAALATIAGYVLQYDEGMPIEGIFTFGSPRVGNDAFAAYFNNQSATHVTWRMTHWCALVCPCE